jgi:large subunit ribosomal protein L35
MKTHKGAAKRFKVTGSGRVMAMTHHRNNKKMKKRNEKLYAMRGYEEVDASHRSRVRRLLPYSF